MTTTVANEKHYSAVARQHAKKPDGFVGETAKSTAKPDIAAASGKGVPAKAVASKLVPGLTAKPSTKKGG